MFPANIALNNFVLRLYCIIHINWISNLYSLLFPDNQFSEVRNHNSHELGAFIHFYKILHYRAESHSIVHNVIHEDGGFQGGHRIDWGVNQGLICHAYIHHSATFVLFEVLAIILAIVYLEKRKKLDYSKHFDWTEN